MSEAGTEGLPEAFVDCLLDSVLEPVLEAAVRRGAHAAKRKKNVSEAGEVARALLAVTVCDPACGSGRLLAAAAGRIARRLAAARGEDGAPGSLRQAMREVVGSCMYGVDVSGEAVQQTRDRLRRASDVTGLPPLFLDWRIRPGNALIGASPELIENGIPDQAFATSDGDDRRHARALLRANARPAPGQATLFSQRSGYSHANQALAKDLAKVRRLAGGGPGADSRQAAEYATWCDSAAFRARRLVADAWCAAFAWAKTLDAPPAVVNQVLLDLRELGGEAIGVDTLAEIGRLRDEHRFFHWDLEFPDVFRVGEGETRWRGGFSCVLSAPPRDRIDRRGDSTLFRFATGSGAYPQCTAALAEPGVSGLRADLLFTERMTALLAPGGRAGCAVAPGTAAAAGARHLLGALMRRGALASLYDFPGPGARTCLLTISAAPERDASEHQSAEHNSAEHYSAERNATERGTAERGTAERGTAECGTAERGTAERSTAERGVPELGQPARFAFRLNSPAELADAGRSFPLTPADAARISPNTGALPPLRGARDAALVTAVYRRLPVLWDETRPGGNPWKMRLEKAFPRAAARGLLRGEQELRDEGWEPAGSSFTRDGQRMLPFYEPSMVDRFDHQVARPRYWIAEHGQAVVQPDGETVQRPGVADRLAVLGWTWQWLCAWRAPVREQAALAVFLPRAATADSLPLMLPRVVPPFAAALIAVQSSLVLEYVARQKADGPVMRAADWKQLPVPSPDMLEPHLPFLVPRVLELVYTAPDMSPLARDLDDRGEHPFAPDSGRRAALRAELDAFCFRLYGIGQRDDVEYIIGTLAAGADGLSRGETPEHRGKNRQHRGETPEHRGENRQHRGEDSWRDGKLVLDAYDRMTRDGAAGAGYESRIFPPPGHGPRHIED